MAAALAAAAIPLIISATQDRPGLPVFPTPELPDREAEKRAILALASDPRSAEFQLASNQALDQVNRALAQRGLGSSSLAISNIRGTQAQLAQDFLNEELKRRINAFRAVSGADLGEAQLAMQAATGQFGADRARILDEQLQQQQLIQGIGGLAAAGATAIERQRAADRLERERQIQRATLGQSVGRGSLNEQVAI